jgi:MFS family permease
MDAVRARHDPYASLRIPNFRRFILSLLTMNIATQLQAVVVSWQVYALTRDPLSLGLIGLAEALPFIGFALPAGHLADRVRRLTIARIALAALLGCSVALLWFTPMEGQQVAPDTLLGVIDTVQLALQRAQARAQSAASRSRVSESGRQIGVLAVQRDIARRSYERTRRLFNEKAATAQQLDQTEGEYRTLGQRIAAA